MKTFKIEKQVKKPLPTDVLHLRVFHADGSESVVAAYKGKAIMADVRDEAQRMAAAHQLSLRLRWRR